MASSFLLCGLHRPLLEEITETKFRTKINHMQSWVLWDCSLMCLWKDPNVSWRVRHHRLCWVSSVRSSRSAFHPVLCPGRLTRLSERVSLQLWDPATSSYVQPVQTPAGDQGLGWGWVFIPNFLPPCLSSWDGCDSLLKVAAPVGDGFHTVLSPPPLWIVLSFNSLQITHLNVSVSCQDPNEYILRDG